MEELLRHLSRNLKTYSGRDACIRLVAYFSKFIYGLFQLLDMEVYEFKVLSSQFSNCRCIMRFFDDIPAIYSFICFFRKNKNVSFS
jgi:hypothetical protein